MLTRQQLSQALSRRRKRGSLTVLPTDVFYSGLTEEPLPPAEAGDVIVMPTVMSKSVTTDYAVPAIGLTTPVSYEALDVAAQYYKVFHYGINFRATANKVRTISAALRNDLDAVINPVHPGVLVPGTFNSHMHDQVSRELEQLGVSSHFTPLPSEVPLTTPVVDMNIQRLYMQIMQTEGSIYDPSMIRRDIAQVGRQTPGGSLVTHPAITPFLRVYQELWMGCFEPLVRAYFPRSGAVMYAPASLFFMQEMSRVHINQPIENVNADQLLAGVTYIKHPDWTEVVITHAFFPSTPVEKVNLLPYTSQYDDYTYKITAKPWVISWVPASHPVKVPLTLVPLDMTKHDQENNKMVQFNDTIP